MKKVNSIRIFFILTVILGIGCYQAANYKSTDEPDEPMATEQLLVEEPESETECEALPVSRTNDYQYIILEESDYLTVYFADRETVYEYTDIQYSNLPDTLRQKIRKGYCIKDEAELFGFLENYSS